MPYTPPKKAGLDLNLKELINCCLERLAADPSLDSEYAPGYVYFNYETNTFRGRTTNGWVDLNGGGGGGSGDIMSDGSVPFTGEEDFTAGIKSDQITESTVGNGVNVITTSGGQLAENGVAVMLTDGSRAGASGFPQDFGASGIKSDYVGESSPGFGLFLGVGNCSIKIDNAGELITIVCANGLLINGHTAYNGTLADAIADGKNVSSGIIIN